MIKKEYRLPIYLIVFACSLIYPIYQIVNLNYLMDYEIFPFEVSLYDPLDLFRGRYVALSYVELGKPEVHEAESIPQAANRLSQKVWATLQRDGDVTKLSKIYFDKKHLPKGEPFVKIDGDNYYISWQYEEIAEPERFEDNKENRKPAVSEKNSKQKKEKTKKIKTVRVTRLPISKYFMNEKLAPEAEKLLASTRGHGTYRGERVKAILHLRVYENGHVASEKMTVGDKTIEEFVEQSLKEQAAEAERKEGSRSWK